MFAKLVLVAPLLIVILGALIEYFARFRYPVFSNGGAIFITSWDKGIGSAAAKRLLKHGYHIIIGVQSQKELEEIKQLNDEHLEGVLLLRDNYGDTSIHLVENKVRSWCNTNKKPLVALIHNSVQISTTGFLLDWNPESYLNDLKENLYFIVKLNQKFIPLFLENKGGRILYVGSIQGTLPIPLNSPYASIKAAIKALAQGTRYELLSLGIASIYLEFGFFQVESSFLLGNGVFLEENFLENKIEEENKRDSSENDHFLFKKIQKTMKIANRTSWDLNEKGSSNDLIYDAIVNPRPKPHYVGGGGIGHFSSASIMYNIISVVPVSLIDWYLSL